MSDILWQIFIEMKLMNVLKEQEEKRLSTDLSNLPHKKETIRSVNSVVLVDTYDEDNNRIVVSAPESSFNETMNTLKVNVNLYDTDGTFKLTPFSLSNAVRKVFELIQDNIDLKSYSSTELSKYTFRVYEMTINYQTFRTSIMEVLPANVSNRLLHPYGFLALSQYTPQEVGDLYDVSPEYLPKFPEDMGLTIQRLIKRIKVIYKTMKKGKINGLPYELGEPDIKVLPDFRTYDNREKKYGLGLHGFLNANILYYGSEETTWNVLDRNMRKIVYDTIKDRFQKFDIEYKTINQDV